MSSSYRYQTFQYHRCSLSLALFPHFIVVFNFRHWTQYQRKRIPPLCSRYRSICWLISWKLFPKNNRAMNNLAHLRGIMKRRKKETEFLEKLFKEVPYLVIYLYIYDTFTYYISMDKESCQYLITLLTISHSG